MSRSNSSWSSFTHLRSNRAALQDLQVRLQQVASAMRACCGRERNCVHGRAIFFLQILHQSRAAAHRREHRLKQTTTRAHRGQETRLRPLKRLEQNVRTSVNDHPCPHICQPFGSLDVSCVLLTDTRKHKTAQVTFVYFCVFCVFLHVFLFFLCVWSKLQNHQKRLHNKHFFT